MFRHPEFPRSRHRVLLRPATFLSGQPFNSVVALSYALSPPTHQPTFPPTNPRTPLTYPPYPLALHPPTHPPTPSIYPLIPPTYSPTPVTHKKLNVDACALIDVSFFCCHACCWGLGGCGGADSARQKEELSKKERMKLEVGRTLLSCLWSGVGWGGVGWGER